MNSIIFSGVCFLCMFGLCSGVWVYWWWRYSFIFSREGSGPFECGFDAKDSARLPFSIRFFLLLMLFLVFDIELVLLLQIPLYNGGLVSGFFMYFFFFFFVVGGTLEEWRRGVFKWKV